MPCSNTSACLEHRSCGSENDFSTILDGDFHNPLSILTGTDSGKPLHHHLVSQTFFHIDASGIMGADPVALLRDQLMHKCNIQIRRHHGERTAVLEVFLIRGGRLRVDFDYVFSSDSLYCRPNRLKTAQKFRIGHGFNGFKRI